MITKDLTSFLRDIKSVKYDGSKIKSKSLNYSDGDDIRAPSNLPQFFFDAKEIDADYIERYMLEVVKRNKISVGVARILKEWFIEKSELSLAKKDNNQLDESLDDIELLISRISKVEIGVVTVNPNE